MKPTLRSITVVALGLLLVIACKNDTKSEKTSTTTQRAKNVSGENFTYVSTDGSHRFKLQNIEDGIILTDMTNNTSYTMKHVPSGSGAKYEGEDGHVFWNKGKEFTFYKGDTKLTQGALLEAKTSKHVGNYVSEGYEKRNEGYDWVAVSITKAKFDKLNITIRSRADKKKPTCTFDTTASKISENTYKAYENNVAIIFVFQDSTVSISTENDADSGVLSFYCSGGGSLKGEYTLISDEALDPSQVDKTLFSKVLTLQNIGFTISSVKDENTNSLTIAPFGLSVTNEPVTHNIDGTVTNAEIEDLNADGFPEVLVYVQGVGSGSYGSVVGYSVNNGKSMSQIYLPPVTENKEANKGYMGHDEFAIVETTFVQRFPVYKKGDTNANPTGGTRQIQYKLKDGEASRKFVVDKVVEY